MKRIFGSKKNVPPPPTLQDAGAKLDVRTAALDEKIRKLEGELSVYKEKLKKARGPAQRTLKQRALAVLKRKRMYEQQRDQLAGQAFNVEQTNFAIESVKDTLTTVDAMKQASKTLKTQVKKVDIDQIEDVQDDLADMMEEMNEVQDVLGQSYGIGDDIDDADLDAELDALGDDFDDIDVADATPAYLQPLPEQPDSAPVPQGTDGQPLPAAVDEFGLPVAAAS